MQGYYWWFDIEDFVDFNLGAWPVCPFAYHLCLIFPCQSRIGQTEEQTKSKTKKLSAKPPWSLCIPTFGKIHNDFPGVSAAATAAVAAADTRAPAAAHAEDKHSLARDEDLEAIV